MKGHGSEKIRLGPFTVVCRPNALDVSRLGVTATKKVGSACDRNRFKRLAREFFRINRLDWPSGLDILFIALAGFDSFKPGLLGPKEAEKLRRFFFKALGAKKG
jgi:ribonuclease P protein component